MLGVCYMCCALLWLIKVLDLHGIWNHRCRVMFIVLELKEGVEICNRNTVLLCYSCQAMSPIIFVYMLHCVICGCAVRMIN